MELCQQSLIEFLGSPGFIIASTNSSRLVAKLKSAVERNELYETHQILRTIHFRFINSKDKVHQLTELLFIAACHLLRNQEFVSGQDIGVLFLEACARCLQSHREQGETSNRDWLNPSLTHHAERMTLDWEISQKIATILIGLPDTDLGQKKYTGELLKIITPKLLNRQLLHEVLADRFWKNGNFANSRYHYLFCASLDNVENIATMLIGYQTTCPTSQEIDLTISQFILQFLCLQSPKDSPIPTYRKAPVSGLSSAGIPQDRATIKSIVKRLHFLYIVRHPQLGQKNNEPFTTYPLLNFVYFIITISNSSQAGDIFKMLCDVYKPVWSRDSTFKGYLSRFGTVYLGLVELSPPRQGGLINNMLLSLFETDDDDEIQNSGQTDSMEELD